MKYIASFKRNNGDYISPFIENYIEAENKEEAYKKAQIKLYECVSYGIHGLDKSSEINVREITTKDKIISILMDYANGWEEQRVDLVADEIIEIVKSE